MATPSEFSATNIGNSLSLYLGAQCIQADLVVYWHELDALQIGTGTSDWYFEFSTNRTAILATPEVQTALNASRGVLTMYGAFPAEPRFIQRLISDVTAGSQQDVVIPALTFVVSPELMTQPYEIGTKLKWRKRSVMVEVITRTAQEQLWFADRLMNWLDDETAIVIHNHDDQSLTELGVVETERVRVEMGTFTDAAMALTYQIVSGMWVNYVA